MLRKMRGVAIVLCLSAWMVLMGTGCSDGGASAAAPAAPGQMPSARHGDEVMGVVATVEGGALTLDLMERGDMGGPPPDMSGMPEGFDGSMPEGFEGGRPDGDGQGGGRGGMGLSGETRTVAVNDDTAVTGMDGGALTLADVAEGAMVRVSLADDGETATAITVMQQMRGDGAA